MELCVHSCRTNPLQNDLMTLYMKSSTGPYSYQTLHSTMSKQERDRLKRQKPQNSKDRCETAMYLTAILKYTNQTKLILMFNVVEGTLDLII